jgi:hypothetical protein
MPLFASFGTFETIALVVFIVGGLAMKKAFEAAKQASPETKASAIGWFFKLLK